MYRCLTSPRAGIRSACDAGLQVCLPVRRVLCALCLVSNLYSSANRPLPSPPFQSPDPVCLTSPSSGISPSVSLAPAHRCRHSCIQVDEGGTKIPGPGAISNRAAAARRASRTSRFTTSTVQSRVTLLRPRASGGSQSSATTTTLSPLPCLMVAVPWVLCAFRQSYVAQQDFDRTSKDVR